MQTVQVPSIVASPATLGQTLRSHRKATGLRIDTAAALVGISTDALSRLETGQGVRLDTLLKVLDGLGLALILTAKEDPLLLQLQRKSGQRGVVP